MRGSPKQTNNTLIQHESVSYLTSILVVRVSTPLYRFSVPYDIKSAVQALQREANAELRSAIFTIMFIHAIPSSSSHVPRAQSRKSVGALPPIHRQSNKSRTLIAHVPRPLGKALARQRRRLRPEGIRSLLHRHCHASLRRLLLLLLKLWLLRELIL